MLEKDVSEKVHWVWHVVALVTIIVWGTTFASTKVLLSHGLTPPEIMVERFVIAYVCILPFCHKKWLADSLWDELRMVLLGVTGGSLYFWTENTALSYTTSSNVALLICVTPLLTSLLTIIIFKEVKLTRRLAIGSLVALLGEVFVVLNGNFLVEVNPLGDALAFSAALCWAVYSVLIRPLNARYDTLFLTRKVFFYGLLTMLPVVLLHGSDAFHPSALTQPVVWGNLLFLGLVASFGCFFSWNMALRKLDLVVASNYMYCQPLVSLTCSVIIL
ncbi:MAG: DMT family transporter, partial [Bacteroidaceae bacterium]|nr:DMT family transporter [Bacteroidaceae bacterium]